MGINARRESIARMQWRVNSRAIRLTHAIGKPTGRKKVRIRCTRCGSSFQVVEMHGRYVAFAVRGTNAILPLLPGIVYPQMLDRLDRPLVVS
jgi:hypothetical protein